MKRALNWVAWLSVFVTGSAASASTYYVSTAGSDSGSGTAGQPFLTVQHALDTAQPGDVVRVGPGTYRENVFTPRSGTASAPIILDGQGSAIVQSFDLRNQYINLQNFILKGRTNAYCSLLYMNRGAHYCTVSNNIIDAAFTLAVYPVSWRAPATKPFGDDAGSHNLLVSNLITRAIGSPMVSIMGDGNVIKGNRLLDGAKVDFFRLWGRSNYIVANLCSNNFATTQTANHPDFIQTFGNNGFGSRWNVIEGNRVFGIEGGQLTQLTTDLVPEIRDWTFRNNIFVDVELQGSCSIPGVKYYNNLFLRCNTVNGGHVIYFGSHAYDTTNVLSGQLIQGMQYHVATASGTGTVVYASVSYKNGKTFTATALRDFVTVGDAILKAQLIDKADGTQVINNIFLDCGDARTNVGWYGISTNLVNVAADYNYVGKLGYKPVRADPQQRAVGDPRGWDYMSMFWYEPHGINGGLPGLVSEAGLDFRLSGDSRLVDAGSAVSEVVTDITGASRPQGSHVDIGPYENVSGEIISPPPPANFRVVH